MVHKLFRNPPLVERSEPQLSSGVVVIFFVIAALVLPGCIYINVTQESEISGTTETQTTDQDPLSPGQSVEPIGNEIPALLSGCNECHLNLTNHQQQTGSWCWAASTRTVIEFIHPYVFPHDESNDQCDEDRGIVGKVFSAEVNDANAKRAAPAALNEINCCKAKRNVSMTEPGREESLRICDNTLWPSKALRVIDVNFLPVKYDPPFDYGQGWEDLTGQIQRKLPYLAVFRLAGGGRHAVAVGGYLSLLVEGEYVKVYDPGQQGFTVTLFQDFYAGIPGQYAHEWDYFNIGQ